MTNHKQRTIKVQVGVATVVAILGSTITGQAVANQALPTTHSNFLQGTDSNSPQLIAQTKLAQVMVGRVEKMVSGDLMCYVTLVDDKGVRHPEIGATFEICNNENAYLNKRVSLVYGQVQVNDCQSAEPCGRTRRQSLIVQMKVVDNNSARTCSRGASAGYPIPRMKVGMRGYAVTQVNIRQQPGASRQLIGSLAPGSKFTVLQGPECVGNYVWWKVSTGRMQGWAAEADPATSKYWLAPNR